MTLDRRNFLFGAGLTLALAAAQPKRRLKIRPHGDHLGLQTGRCCRGHPRGRLSWISKGTRASVNTLKLGNPRAA